MLGSLLPDEARVEDEPRRSRRPSLLSAPGLLTSADRVQLESRSGSEAASPERPRRSSMRQPSLLSAPGALGPSLPDEVSHRYDGDHRGDSQPRAVSSSVHAEHEHGVSPGQRSSGQRRASLPPMATVSPEEHGERSGNHSSRRRSWSPSAAEQGHALHAANASHAAAGDHLSGPGLGGSTLSSSTSDEEESLHAVTGRSRAATDAAVFAAASGEQRGESCEEEAVWHVGLSPHSAPELHDTQGRRCSSMRQPSLLSAPGALGSSLADEVLHRYHGDHRGDSQPRAVSSSVHAEHEHGVSPGQRSSGQRRASLPPMATVSPEEHGERSGNHSSRRRSWSPSAAEQGHAPHAANASHAAAGDHLSGPGLGGSTLSSSTSDEEESLHAVTGRSRAATDAAVFAAASGEQRGESCEEEAVWHVGLSPHSAPELHDTQGRRCSSMRQPSLLSAPGALGSSLADEVLHRYHGDHRGDSQPRAVSSSVHAEHEHGVSPGQRSSGQRRASLPPMATVSPEEHGERSGNHSSRRRSWSPSAAEQGHAPHAANASHAAAGDHLSGPGLGGSTLSSSTSDEEESLHAVTGRSRAATDAAVFAAASGEQRGESCEEEAVWHVGLSPHSAPELHDTQGRRCSSMLQPSLLSAPGALGSSLPDEVLHRYHGDHQSRQVSQATDVAGVSRGDSRELLEQQAAWHGSLSPHSAPELHGGNPSGGSISQTSLLSAPGALGPASHQTHRPHEIQEVFPMHPELAPARGQYGTGGSVSTVGGSACAEVAGDSASGTIIMDTGAGEG